MARAATSVVGAMGLYRTVHAVLDCAPCGARFSAQVQFKTGYDACEEHRDGECVDDLPAGAEYAGLTDRYCGACSDHRAADAVRAYCSVLRAALVEGEADFSVGGRQLTGPGGASELEALFAPVTARARGYRTGDLIVLPGAPPIPTEVRIVCGDQQLWPLLPEVNIWTGYEAAFWRRLERRVVERMGLAGWSGDADRSVIVRIGSHHHIEVL